MKKKYIRILLLVPLILMIAQVSGQVPNPDALYRFNETTGNVIADSSGNNNHAWWYNYAGLNPGATERTGWRPDEGYRGGAGYFNGDHVYCENPCSSGSDLIIFKTSEMHSCDDEIPANNQIFKKDMNNFTVSFWYKNNWDYLCEAGAPPHRCYEDESGCAWERQVLFTMGGSNSGLVLETFAGTTFPALIRLTIAGGDKEQRVVINAHHPAFYENEWVHYAIVFEGDSVENTGKVRLYLDFELVNNGERDTPFGTIEGHGSSVVFGAQAGASVTDFNIDGECWGQVYELCGITADQVGRLRYGWLARGWIDDFAFWASESLTKEQLVEFDEGLVEDDDDDDDDDDTSVRNFKLQEFKVIPSHVSDHFRVSGLHISDFDVIVFNYLGQKITRYHSVNEDQQLQIASELNNGLYLIGVEKSGVILGIQKMVLSR
jgi:hypothetical protein